MSAAAAVNGGDAAKQAPSFPSNANTSNNKPSASRTNGPSLAYNAGGSASANGKTLDNTRRSAGSPQTDANHSRKPPPPRAWQTHNPLIRGNNTNGTPSPPNSTPNGASAHQQPNKAAPPPQRATSESSLTDKQAHDRTLYLLANLVGRDVTLTLKSGETFAGVFFGSSPSSAGAAASSPSKFQHLLKMVRRGGDGGEYVGEGEDFSMAFDVQETQVLSVLEVPLTTTTTTQQQQGAAAAGATANGARFMTDTQISSRDHNRSQRELQRWTPGLESSSSTIGTALEESSSSSSTAGWDQFAANEKLYGVESTYDESIYTTAINRQDPNFRRRQQEADRIAREIEASAPATAHVAEERREHAVGGAAGTGEDEEEKYSGVLRRDVSSTPTAAGTASATSSLPKRAAGAYVPPSQRAIANAPTVPGAPFDPAIISTQLDPSPIAPSQPVTSASGQQQQSASPAAPVLTAPTEPSQRGVSAETTTARPTATTTATAPAVAAVVAKDKPSGGGPVTTEAIVRETADAFKQFVGNEKMRLQAARHQAQEAKRSTVRAEKTVKLNDLKKFAANFKLHSRVPDDLVPILAKDREKQLEIQSKAEEAAKENESKAKEKVEGKAKETVVPSAATATAAAAATATPAAATTTTTAPAAPPSAPSQLPSGDARAYQQHPRGRGSQQGGRGGFVPAGGAPAQSPRIPLGQRIQGNLQYYPQQQQQQQQMPPPPQPSPFDRPRSDLRIPSTVSAASDSVSPASATRLNVNAKAFEFRPGASTFAPSGASQSPPRRGSAVASATAKKSEPAPRAFFDSEEARLAPCVPATFDPLDWLANAKDLDDKKKQQAAANGGVLHSYTTLPTWSTTKDNANVSYLAAFTKQPASSSSQGPMPVTPLRQPSIGVIPPQFSHAGGYHPQQQHPHHANGLTVAGGHHHQMLPTGGPQAIPMHLAGPQRSQQQHFYPQPPPHMMAPQFTHHPHLPPHLQQQPGYNVPMLGSSPRQQQAYAAAQAGMPFGGQMAQMGVGAPPPFAQAPAPYAGSPGMTFRQLSNAGPPGAAGPPPQMMMMPGGGGGPPNGMRGGGAGYAGAHMMVQQPSQQGAYPQQQQPSQFSSPMPQHAQPMMGGGPGGYMQQPQQQSSSPYQGSPRPMMMQHQGSHQGYNPNNHPNHMGARQMSNGFVAGASGPAQQQQQQQMGTPRGAQAFPMQAQGSQSQHHQQQQQPSSATAPPPPPPTANGSATAAAAENGK